MKLKVVLSIKIKIVGSWFNAFEDHPIDQSSNLFIADRLPYSLYFLDINIFTNLKHSLFSFSFSEKYYYKNRFVHG